MATKITPIVFMVGKEEGGKYHEVSWTRKGGRLPHVTKGSTKDKGCRFFSRKKDAIAFTKKIALQLGEGTDIELDTKGSISGGYLVKNGKFLKK